MPESRTELFTVRSPANAFVCHPSTSPRVADGDSALLPRRAGSPRDRSDDGAIRPSGEVASPARTKAIAQNAQALCNAKANVWFRVVRSQSPRRCSFALVPSGWFRRSPREALMVTILLGAAFTVLVWLPF